VTTGGCLSLTLGRTEISEAVMPTASVNSPKSGMARTRRAGSWLSPTELATSLPIKVSK
jgi:hypothetical protein